MTPLRRTLERFASFHLAVALLAVAMPPAHTSAATRTPRATIAYVPAAIWGDLLERATAGLDLTPHAIYWFEGGEDMGRILGDLERYQADDAKAAPREALVAFVGRYAVYPSNTLAPGVAVMDTTGVLVADFPRARSYAWSPDGTRLVVVAPRELLPRGRGRGAKAVPRYRPGVTVWDRRDNSMRSFPQWPSRAAWAGDDSLLLQLPDRVVVLDTRRGKIAATGHHGTIVSPDSRYAMWPGEGGQNTRIVHEASGAQVTDALFRPYQRDELGQIRSAFWVRGSGAGHLMCLSACDGIQFERPRCRTEVVDARTLDVVESFGGEALGPTADERGVVVFRKSRGRLEFHDLRPVAREWAGRNATGSDPLERDPAEDREVPTTDPNGPTPLEHQPDDSGTFY